MATPTSGGTGGRGGAGGKTSGPAKGSGGKGGAGKAAGGIKNPTKGENVAPEGAVPAHMARRIEKGSVGMKGKWMRWPGVEI